MIGGHCFNWVARVGLGVLIGISTRTRRVGGVGSIDGAFAL